MVNIVKRSGKTAEFNPQKVHLAITKALVEQNKATEISHIVEEISGLVTEGMTVESVQDLIEIALMKEKLFDTAKSFILYRDKKTGLRQRANKRDKEAFDESAKYFGTPSQMYQFYSKYARWNSEQGRRETWEEAIGRVITFLKKSVPDVITSEEWDELHSSMRVMDALPAMRVLQMAGPTLDRCNMGVYNCAAVAIDSLHIFSEILYISMQGTGVAYSVEDEFVHKLPGIRRQKKSTPKHFVVPDTTEGWADAILLGVKTWAAGDDVTFDLSLIRPQGAVLKTKGGRSSGPLPLKGLLEFTKVKILARQGSRLSSLDCHDICCKIGEIVHVGGVRRSALLALFDLDDEEMRLCKQGQFWNQNPQRFMSNNSAAYEQKPSSVEFLSMWSDLAKSGTGEPGIFNRQAFVNQLPKRRKKVKLLTNPCAEIGLRPDGGLCNLSIIVAREDDTPETLKKKARTAAIFGTIQSCLTNFGYVSPIWKKNADEERLLGVDITGQLDCRILRPGASGREELLQSLLAHVRETNVEFARRLGINESVATTCVKPSGNSAQLLNCSSGIHPRYAPFYIRRFRAGRFDPLTQMMMDAGVPWFPETGQSRTECSVAVFEFPVKSPEGSITKDDISAVAMLENWLVWKKNYTEHTVSVTVSVGDNEWLQAGNWVYENWESVTGISFLPRDGGLYALAPYETCTEAEFDKRTKEFPVLDFSKLAYYESTDMTTGSQELACVAGNCET